MRQKIVNSGIIFIFILLFLGLFNLEIIQGKRFRELSNKNCIRVIPQAGSRGKIIDRQGGIIVDSTLSYNVMLLPPKGGQLDDALFNIARILHVNPRGLKEKYAAGYVTSSMPVTIAENIDMRKAIALEELKFDLPGMVIQSDPVRYYPYGKLACHIVGYLNEIDHWRLTKLADYGYKTKDIVGFGGLEEKYDFYLRQIEGGLSTEIDSRGASVRILGFRSPKSGKDIQLTLDLKIQRIVEDALADKKGSIILMEPYSGEIIAMANRPNFNPAVFVRGADYSVRDLFGHNDAPLINRSISGVYPAGSIFKLVVAAAALEESRINLDTKFFCSGQVNIGKKAFSCWDTHNQQGLISAIAHSCNVFFYRTGLSVGPALLHDYALKFGFSKLSSVDLPYEANGFVPHPLWRRIHQFKNWFDGDTANFAIGQGELLVTPLQVARMIAVFANKGGLVAPYIVKAIDGRDVSVVKRKILSLSLNESTIDYIRSGLKAVVSMPKGTAHVLADLPVSVAGKTGTAQVARAQSHGWFAGFFPFEKPKFVICVFLEHGGSGYASSVLAKYIIEEMIKEGLI